MKGLFMNNELERMWKLVVVASSEVLILAFHWRD
jgi:hypothetical protein